MKFEIHSHRNADAIIQNNKEINIYWSELEQVIDSISDDEIEEAFLNSNRRAKSISEAINKLIDEKLVLKNWVRQSPIFKETAFIERARNKSNWRLDFAKGPIAIEVAFNHANDVAWNLIKPVLSSEKNHVEKAIQTELGIIITANEELKKEGGFDNAIGTFEKYVEYLKPLNSILVSPIILIGLKPLNNFIIEKKFINGKNRGYLVKK
jgi:hypothetical protein